MKEKNQQRKNSKRHKYSSRKAKRETKMWKEEKTHEQQVNYATYTYIFDGSREKHIKFLLLPKYLSLLCTQQFYVFPLKHQVKQMFRQIAIQY